MGYSVCSKADFKNCLISRIFDVFSSGFFAQNNSYNFLRSFFACFWHFKFLTQTGHFEKAIYSVCMGYSLCKMGDFQNCLISRIFDVFSSGFFAQNNSYNFLGCFFACFWNFKFLTQTDHFAKAIYSFCMGYSLCKMGGFQNCLISRILDVFFERFFV